MIALVAHDARKDHLVKLASEFRAALERYELVATGTTGGRIADATGLPVRRMLSGPNGGDAQIAALVAEGHIEAVIFLTDPLTAQPHEPDVQSLQRICNVHDVPLAINAATARLILQQL